MAAPTPKFNSKSPTIRRILREAHELTTSPSPDYHAEPLESDLFEWHFTLRGPPHSAFEAGIYHGRIVLPPSYPLRPPSFRFLTPSGRFETNREICLSISGHHEETWQPAWGIRTALVALRTFMETDVKGQLGGLEAGEQVRRRLAAESVGWRCGACGGGKTNGEILAECEARAQEMAGQGAGVEEVKVPEELKMRWKDEMEGQKNKGKEREGERASDDEESARLAEGFVQTAVPAAPRNAEPEAGQRTAGGSTTSPAVRPVPAPRPPGAAPGPALQQVQPRVAEDVPVWLDQLIIGIAVLLAAVVLKVMLD
ncbi:ubiquitin-conjugating enzyme/RWD-like protein [Chaetomium strumarium]|uniref:Ubiquitin-conjugating enzyme/RWD-like protein n=1 Tax=Chaetomium strumarium TaxID=1170767 RepID=A0AAJ0GZ79_9PEZI|nr:ubiquitin-conjugating enzyme/RWD-like protein [Chaetomium strumarium]